MAQIISRGNNKWLVRVFLKRTAEGKRKLHNKVVHGKKKDAQKYARDAETRRDLGTLNNPPTEDPTFDTFLDGWLSDFKKYTVRERTLVGYKYILDRYVRPHLGKHKLSELTVRTIQCLYEHLSDSGYSPRTVAFAHTLIQDALNQAVVDHVLNSTRRPPPKKKLIDAFTQEEAERFMKAAKSDRLGVIFWFALATGGRPEEYLALQWPDLNLDRGEVIINKSIWWPKGGGWKIEEVKTQSSLRTINFDSALARAVGDHKRRQLERRLQFGKKYENHNLVFASKNGTPLDFRNLTLRHLQPIMKKARIKGSVNLYRLRHSFVTLSLLSGADVKTVSRAAGHSSVAFTMDTYQHVLPAMRKDAAEKYASFLFGSTV
ncbi:MAG: tyrosine-type recombinase/integrase [Acidobacteriota bacterium]